MYILVKLKKNLPLPGLALASTKLRGKTITSIRNSKCPENSDSSKNLLPTFSAKAL